MTEVAFHFNVPDKLGYACRLLRKAHAAGSRVVVTGPAEELRTLDVQLWTFSPAEFIPHCHAAAADPAVVDASPVLLADAPRGTPHQEVLVNLGAAVPDGFERFERRLAQAGADEHLLGVRRELGHVVGLLPRPQRPAVLAEVQRVERGTLRVPERGELCLEEVVAPTMDVQHGPDRLGGLFALSRAPATSFAASRSCWRSANRHGMRRSISQSWRRGRRPVAPSRGRSPTGTCAPTRQRYPNAVSLARAWRG